MSSKSDPRPHVTVLVSTKGWGGTEEVTVGLLRTLEARGHETSLLDLCAAVYQRALPAAGLRTSYRHIPLNERLDALSSDEYARIFAEWGTDIAVLSKGDFRVRGDHIDLAARRTGRYVIIEHLAGRMPADAFRVLGVPVTLNYAWYRRRRHGRRHLRSADIVVCVSAGVEARLTTEYGHAWRRRVVHNGIDTDAFRFSAAARARMRDAWRIPATSFVFGVFGRLSAEKAPEVAVDRFADITRSAAPGVDARLAIVGDGPDRGALEARVRSLGIDARVRFIGSVTGAARPEALAAFDAFLMPSRAEGLPLALLEAMAVERPCLASAVGGIAEVLSEPSLGWLTPAGDDVAFGEAMRACLASPEADRTTMGVAARTHVQRHFESRAQLNKLADAVLGEGNVRNPQTVMPDAS